jgi:hypothetical protein
MDNARRLPRASPEEPWCSQTLLLLLQASQCINNGQEEWPNHLSMLERTIPAPEIPAKKVSLKNRRREGQAHAKQE